jgi:LmbE family N-acetylglucosaminyl deacetylase
MIRVPARVRRFFKPMVRAGSVLNHWSELPLTDVPSLVGTGPVLVLAPHPDDESLGCGGLIADCVSRGQIIRVMILTDGSASHPNSRSYPPDRLAALREAETRDALAALGVASEFVTFLRLPDGRAPIRGKGFKTVTMRIVEAVREWGIVTICTTWPGDPHHDHRAAYRLGEIAAQRTKARLLCYPIWGWTLPSNAWVPSIAQHGGRIDITPHLPAKQRAIACHRSQTTDLIADDPTAFRLSPAFLANFTRSFEVFFDTAIEAGGKASA